MIWPLEFWGFEFRRFVEELFVYFRISVLCPDKEKAMQQKRLTGTVLLVLIFLMAGNGWGEQKSADGTNQMMCKLDQPGKYSTYANDSKNLQLQKLIVEKL